MDDPAARQHSRAGLRPELLTGLGCAVGVVLLGAPVGLLWSVLAPRPDVVPTAGGGLDFVNSETKDFITADAYLFLLCLAAGVVAGAVAWRFARRRPLGSVLGLLVGAGLAAWIAWRTGVLGGDRQALLKAAREGRLTGPVDLPLQLKARTVLLGWPGAAALTFAVLALRRPVRRAAAIPEPGSPEVSSG